jgi:hypothetical protein
MSDLRWLSETHSSHSPPARATGTGRGPALTEGHFPLFPLQKLERYVLIHLLLSLHSDAATSGVALRHA